MSKTILAMLINSKFKLVYTIFFLLPIVSVNIYIYTSKYNFSILMFINIVALIISAILSFELNYHENGTTIFNYLKTLKGENYVYLYRTWSIFKIAAVVTILSSLVINIIYAQYTLVFQQITYLSLILLSLFFYTYFLQYALLSLHNILFRNVIILSVSIISLLALMTRNLLNYLMFVSVLGLFFAISILNRRLTNELKRSNDNLYKKE